VRRAQTGSDSARGGLRSRSFDWDQGRAGHHRPACPL